MEEIAQRIKALEKGVSRGLSAPDNRTESMDSVPAEHSDSILFTTEKHGEGTHEHELFERGKKHEKCV